ncbi:hypothetical protein [Thalassomonas haliotis]|uniref:FTR1 family iron permease n=1 Tax=Thalassomonas haliotis TaxID=485448 RepID=A0ABY7V7S8_9GAMM|nr:hypothetical protein [Thalassomonas haliotis]WDE09710.1 hypothetical protein H3N35_15415 [Thalassomonas haliotis]
MLINTVVLFLRDGLPIFLMLVLLLLINNQLALGRHWLYGGIAAGIAGSILLVSQVDVVASTLEGTGLEWFYSLGYIFIYLGILLALYAQYARHKRLWSALSLLLLLAVLTLHSSNFLVYITGYWSQSDTLKPQLIGIVLGLGILLSISILVFFALEFSDRRLYAFTTSWLTLLFGAGQLLQASKLLLQIDMLPGQSPLWDSNHLLEESSGMGHFLTALFGYDASPSLIQVSIYLMAVILPVSYLLLAETNKRKVNQKEKLL